MKSRALILLFLSFLGQLAHGWAQEVVATAPAGYFTITARGGSDTILSLPLVRRSHYIGRLDSITADTMTFSSVQWTPSEFAPTSDGSYYAQFVSGPLAGVNYRITDNSANSLSVETNGDNLTGHILGQIATGTAGDVVRIRKLWTVGAVFGVIESDTLLAPTENLDSVAYRDGDLILVPDNFSIGVDKQPAFKTSFLSGAGWRLLGQPSIDGRAIPFWPGVPFTLRRHDASPVDTIIVGYVPTESIAVRTPALSSTEVVDVSIAPAYPYSVNLQSSNLGSVVETSVNFEEARDVFLIYSVSRRGFALPFEERTFRTDVDWLSGATPANNYPLIPGAGYVLRLKGARPVRYWIQLPPY